MSSIALCNSSFSRLKNALRVALPAVKSAHMDEALAFALGFRTYAAAQTFLLEDESKAPFRLLDSAHFNGRLANLGYRKHLDLDAYSLSAGKPEELIVTAPKMSGKVVYKSKKSRAWRNLMVCAINAALSQKLFTLRPGENNFGYLPRRGKDGAFYDFVLPNGLPARAMVCDGGFDELIIQAAVDPKPCFNEKMVAARGTCAGGGSVWLERRRGAWMQGGYDVLMFVRPPLLSVLSELDVSPEGYGDRGPIVF